MWKSRALVLGAISKRGGRRGKVGGTSLCRLALGRTFPRFPRARHFHSDTPTALPVSGRSARAPPEAVEVLVRVREQAKSFFQEVKS